MSQSGFYTNETLEAPTGTAETTVHVNEGSDEFVPYTEEEWAARKKNLDAWYWEYACMGKKNGKEYIKCNFQGCANESMFSFAQKSASSFTRHLAKHDLTDPVAAERAGVINAQAQERSKRGRPSPNAKSKGTPDKADKLGKKARKTAPGKLPQSVAGSSSAVTIAPSPWAAPPQPGATPIMSGSALTRPINNVSMAHRTHIRVQCEGLLETANVSFTTTDTFPEIVRRAASALARATDGPLASILHDQSNMRDVLRDRGGYIVGDLCDLVPDELYRLVLL